MARRTSLKLKFFFFIAISFFVQRAFGNEFQNFKIKDWQKWENLRLAEPPKRKAQTLSPGLSIDLVEHSPIYRDILSYFGQHYQSISERQLRASNNGQDLVLWGGLNHIGLSYTKPFANFNVELQRQVAPDLFEDRRFIVADIMNIYIDAVKLLGSLKDRGIIEISEKKLLAFSGLTFKRSYQYIHFAESYQKAITLNLNRLFFSFLNFRSNSFLQLAPYEMLTKEDYFGVQGGALGNLPLTTGLSASIGGIVNYYKLAKTEIQSLGPEDQKERRDEALRMSFQTSKVLQTGFQAGVLADFFQIIRVTLFGFDFNYALGSSYKINLSLNREAIREVQERSALTEQIGRILKHKMPNLEVLAPHLVSEERRRKEVLKSKYYLLLFGRFKNQETQYIQIAKEGRVKTFFRHNFEKSNYREDFLGWLTAMALRSFLRLDGWVKKGLVESKGLRIEYDSNRNLIKSREDLVLKENDEKLSLNFFREFYVYKTMGLWGKSYKKRILKLLENYSGADPLIPKRLREGQLVGPFRFKTRLSLGKAAIDYFNNLSLNEVYDKIDNLCEVKGKSKIWRWLRNPFRRCQRKLRRNYDDYLKEQLYDDYTAKQYSNCRKRVKRLRRGRYYSSSRKRKLIKSCLQKVSKKPFKRAVVEIPLWRLRFFLQNMHDESRTKLDIYSFFGWNNVFIDGNFQAKRSDGRGIFINFFKEGVFRGTGIVSKYLLERPSREKLNRLPASSFEEPDL